MLATKIQSFSENNIYFWKKVILNLYPMALTIIAVLLRSHAGDTLEITVEGCGLREAEQVGCFLKRRCGM